MTSKEKKQSLLNLNKKRRMVLSKSTRYDTRDINMNYGNRTLQITSMNVDTLRTKESIYALILNLESNKVDIACIQETHNERNDNVDIGNYKIFFGGNGKISDSIHETKINTKSGVAIAIRKTLSNNIKQVIRINGRLMELRLKTGSNLPTISILNTYTPHMGYDVNYRNTHWDIINAYIDSIPHNNTIIWCNDNNGQLSKSLNKERNSIGNWALGNKCEEGNGINLQNCCNEHNLICANTFFIPKNNNKRNLATWHNHDGEISRQIDYVMISNKHRNWIKQIKTTKLQIQDKQCSIK